MIVASALLFSVHSSEAGQQKKKFNVPGVMCASSALAATYAVTAVTGVISVTDDTEKETLTIVFDDEKTSIEKIREALAVRGFRVEGEPVEVP